MFSKLDFVLQGLWALFLMILNDIVPSLLNCLPGYGSLQTNFASLSITNKKDLTDQVIIVTGSNTGIGKQSATQLASLGATVVLACRDERKGESAAKDINAQLKSLSFHDFPNASHGKALFMKLDLMDLHSVFDFAANFKKQYSRLDVLVNNAGLNSDGLLINGLQQLFQVNYLGHYLLVRCLEDVLRCRKTAKLGEFSSSSGRVVNLSSVMHHGGQPNFKASALRKFSRSMRTKYSYYDDSKLYMNLLTLEVNRRSGLVTSDASSDRTKRPLFAISANPGAVSSDIWRNVPLQSAWKTITGLVFLTPEQGAATTVCAATLDEQCVEQYQRAFPQAVSVGSGMAIRGDVPYLIPYHMPYVSLSFELLGAFAGAKLGAVSLPQHSAEVKELAFERVRDQNALLVRFESPEDLAKQLWDYSAELCRRILIQSGVSEDELKFLV